MVYDLRAYWLVYPLSLLKTGGQQWRREGKERQMLFELCNPGLCDEVCGSAVCPDWSCNNVWQFHRGSTAQNLLIWFHAPAWGFVLFGVFGSLPPPFMCSCTATSENQKKTGVPPRRPLIKRETKVLDRDDGADKQLPKNKRRQRSRD